MIVIVDSGSTKADWKMVDKSGIQSITTVGFNPVFHDEERIYGELQKSFVQEVPTEKAETVYYYGAGCWDERLKGVVHRALDRVFERADIEVHHDLLGAARATCGHDPGIACIIGTGSNSCLYDGKDVIDNVTNLGFLLGDEGSGTHLGKRLIRAFFYREMPKVLHDELESSLKGGKQSILDQVYNGETPNVYLASFTKFMGDHQDHPFIQRILFDSFEQFIDRHVRKYRNHMSLPIHFIGSVAYYFKETLSVILDARDMKMGNFIQKPIDELVRFHTED